MSKTIGLDLATNTGWCILEDGVYLSSGEVNFKKKRGENNGVLFLKFRKWLIELLSRENDIQILAYEAARMRGGPATEICMGLQTHSQSIAEENNILSYPVNTNTLKKRAAGNGRASKKMMIEAARRRTGVDDITSDDRADAIHVAFLAWEDLNPTSPNNSDGSVDDSPLLSL